MASFQPRRCLAVATSRIGRAVAFSVFACIVLVELVLLVPSALRYEQSQVEQLVHIERGKLVAIMRASDSGLETVDLETQERLLGLAVYSQGGALLYVSGEPPAIEHSAEQAELPPRYDADTVQVGWKLLDKGSSVLAFARLDASHISRELQAYILRILGLVLVISLSVTLGALLVTHRIVLLPLHSVIEAIRANRAGERRDRLIWRRHDELGVLVDEYNDLLDEQEQAQRQVELKQKYLEYMAHHDALTNLPNRIAFTDQLRNHIEQRPDEPLLLMLIDIDRFKRFNDLHGQRVGDKLLAEAARRVQSFANGRGAAARLEGDELILMLQGSCDNARHELAAALHASLEEPHYLQGMRFDVRVSIGYTRYPALALDADSLLRQVNMALDEAKRRGRAQSCEFEISIRQRITEREALEADIRQALIEEQFSVHYQPKIDIRSGAITGVEALVRWQHPRRGNVPPDAFIPLCEECGLVVPLGEWVLQRACRDAQRWQSLGLPPLSVAVNISAAQMQSHILLDTVHGALAASGLRPELLELEITESAMMEDPEEVIVLVRSLHDLGIQLAIDDFGTGYSSLTYLKRFPVNTLKIDKSFVDDVTCDRDDAAIVGAVIDLGQHFALKIVAEGVEDEAQLAFLAARGCDIAQGYFYSRPLPNGALIEWVREHETQRAKAADASDAAQR